MDAMYNLVILIVAIVISIPVTGFLRKTTSWHIIPVRIVSFVVGLIATCILFAVIFLWR